MDRTGASHLIPGARASHEADEARDAGQSDPRSDFGEVEAKLGGGTRNRATRGRGLGEMRDRAHVEDGGEKRNPYESPAPLTGKPTGCSRVKRPPMYRRANRCFKNELTAIICQLNIS